MKLELAAYYACRHGQFLRRSEWPAYTKLLVSIPGGELRVAGTSTHYPVTVHDLITEDWLLVDEHGQHLCDSIISPVS